MSEQHPIREVNDSIEHVLHLDTRRKLRIVAIIDIVKGVAILVVGLGLLAANRNVLENGGMSLLQLLDLDPGNGIPRKFLALLRAADMEHVLLTLAAGGYAAIRFLEAYGLWFGRLWARWLGLFSAGIYVPFELFYLVEDPGVTTFGVLMINLAVLWLLWPRNPLPPPPTEYEISETA